MRYYIEQISRWGMKDVENEITYFCISHNINPRYILMNLSMCGLHWVLEYLSSKIYLSKTKIDNIIREKIQILLIFSEESLTTFELIDRINNTNDINEKLEFWNQYFDALNSIFLKLMEFDSIISIGKLLPPKKFALSFNEEIFSI